MKPSLYLLKREIGRSLENSKTEIRFTVVDSEIRKDYPANFVCVLPLSQGLLKGHSAFGKLFGEDSANLARKLLTKALARESDSETRIEIVKRLKLLTPKTTVESKCRVYQNSLKPKGFTGTSEKLIHIAGQEWS